MAKQQKCNQLRVKVIEIGETQEVGSNGFRKRNLHGLIDGEYPENYQFEFTQDNVDLLDDILEDTYVTVNYNLRSRMVFKKDNKGNETDEKMFFLSLNGWKVEA